MKQLILCLVLLASSVQAQCPPGQVCPVPPGWPASQPNIRPAGVAAASSQPAVVRVICATQEGPWMSTGVLVRPPVECKVGIVLTVDHGIPSQPDSVVVVFHDCRVTASLLGRDASLDLAVLSIPMPRTKPYEIATEPPRVDDVLWAGGYAGPNGRFQVVSGNFLHYATPDDPPGPEKSVLMFAGSVETGVSGGPITDYRGHLVGIVSGGDHEVVVGTHCVYIRGFLNRILSPATPEGMSPMVPPPATKPSLLGVANPLDKIRGLPAIEKPEIKEPSPLVDPAKVVDANNQRVAEIQAGIAKAIDANDKRLAAIKAGFEEVAAETRERMESIATRKSALELAVPAALTALGWTGPPSVVALFAARFGLAAWRRRKRRVKDGGAADSADAFPEGIASVPRDDTEAKQLLQLSRLEGRSPVHDAIIGRFAFDELANTIDRQPDGPEANWARSLRRTLEDRFNETAPVAVYASLA